MPSPRPAPDQAARDLIRQRLDVNLLVEAGAGSGKTTELVRRLVGRGTEDEEERERRLATARVELAAESEFDHVIVNDDVHRATDELVRVMGLEPRPVAAAPAAPAVPATSPAVAPQGATGTDVD